MRIAIFLLAIVGIFVTAFFAGREGWLRSGDDEKHADRNPFQFTWESRGEGGRWMLAVEPGQFESFLLVKRLSPAFEGLSPPMVISSSDDRVFASAVFDEVVGISTATVSSYARLAEDRRPVGRRALRFPLGGCGEVVQADGQVEVGSRPTHAAAEGMIHAVDLKADKGTPVVAALAGQVVFVEDRYSDAGGYQAGKERLDNRVVILHDDGTEAVYAHLMQGSVLVLEGDRVPAGKRLASVGNSGFSQNPHLHFHVGGLNSAGYHTLPVDFLVDGAPMAPVVGQSHCDRSGG